MPRGGDHRPLRDELHHRVGGSQPGNARTSAMSTLEAWPHPVNLPQPSMGRPGRLSGSGSRIAAGRHRDYPERVSQPWETLIYGTMNAGPGEPTLQRHGPPILAQQALPPATGLLQ